MLLGKAILAVGILKSIAARVSRDASSHGHDFNAATVPGWLGKVDNPLVLAAFPEAARLAAIGGLSDPTGTGLLGLLAGGSPTLVSAAVHCLCRQYPKQCCLWLTIPS